MSAEKMKIIGIQVVLMSNTGKMCSLWLPESAEGKYRFDSIDDYENIPDIYFEKREGKWYAYCSQQDYFVTERGECCSSLEIIDKGIFSIYDIREHKVIYTEYVTESSGIYRNYLVKDMEDICIGRLSKNDIVYPNVLVSGTHAVLRRCKNAWQIEDLESRNGVFVNGVKIQKVTDLHLGDCIYIMGLQIFIGVDFISMNDCNDRISVMSDKLLLVQSTDMMKLSEAPGYDKKRDELFNRFPRKRKALDIKPIVIELPPMSLNSNSMPLLLRMGGSMVMGSASLLAGNITSVMSSVLFPVLTQKYTDKQRNDYEERREEKYNEYLEKKSEEIENERVTELSVLSENYPELSKVLNYTGNEKHLWERRKIDDDFMVFRIGNGKYPLLASYEYTPRGFEMEEDALMDKMYELAEKQVYLERAPIMTSFIDDYVCGVLGERKAALSFAHRIILQLSILHSYDEVKIIMLLEQEELKQFEYVKYLPHIWNNQKDFRFLALSSSDGYRIGEYLKQEVSVDLEKPRDIKEILKNRPYYMVFAFNKKIFDSLEVLKDIMQADKNCGVSVLTVFDDLPKECTKIFNLNSSGKNTVIPLKEIEREEEIFFLDDFDMAVAKQSMKEISNKSLRVVTQAYSLPKTLTFLEMFGVGRVEHLNPLKRWQENNPVKSLATPVGVATDGSLFTLDLHEKFQGPHGLIAGMTGSGKSEFIITYILSMAVNYHPDEVAFVLIDYKGGGLAGAFEDKARGIHLPHLVGTITNLDGATIRRSLVSLESEMLRRQQEFNKAKSLSEESTMDIYKYQKLYRNGKIDTPMPHLFIISDEFAELKQQQSEFMDKLISIARIGRSLGVHLILATQKPAGIVNEQIRSNTKFQICLKVQDKADSMDMLKRPEAAEIKETGRFYLQVGYNEFFALGQSAWSGADYEPSDEAIIHRDDSIQIIDSVGQSIYEEKPRAKRVSANKSQLSVIVRMLSQIAEDQGLVQRSLWTPILPSFISIEEMSHLVERACDIPTQVMLGMLDDPKEQRQFPLVYDLCHSQNLLIIGEQGSGKTNLLQSMLYSLIKTCTPEQLNFYILDYSSRMLKMFQTLPHCGAVLLEEDSDSLNNFFDVINGIIRKRKKLFSELEVDNYESANAISPMPIILVMIDGISVLGTSKVGDTHLYKMKEYLKEGGNYGIKYIITASYLSEVPYKVKQELGDCITLRMKDKYSYGEALKCKVEYVPSDIVGRGLYNYEGSVMEFQAVTMYSSTDMSANLLKLKQEIVDMAEKYQEYDCACRLPVLSEKATYEDFSQQFTKGRIPLGYSLVQKKTVALPLKQFRSLSVYFGNPDGVIPLFENLLFAAKREHMDIRIVCRSENSVFAKESDFYKGMTRIPSDLESLRQQWKTLSEEAGARRGVLQKFCEEHRLDETQDDIMEYAFPYLHKNTKPIFILIENLADFSEKLEAMDSLVYDRIFQTAHKRNIYLVAGFEPDDYIQAQSRLVYNSFNLNADILLMGGQFERQRLCDYRESQKSQLQVIAFNVGVMHYREKFHPILIPSGEIIVEQEDEDNKSIF